MEKDSENGELYITGTHARRAIGYLGASLASQGDLPLDFEQPKLLDIWSEALVATMQVEDNPPSPIGALKS
jgi:hypothetical protein